MGLNKRLIGAGATAGAGGITPSEHFGVALYEGDGSSSHSINGGKFGAGAYFDGGSSDKILIGNNLKNIFFDEFSISTWFYITETGNYQTLVGNTDSARDRGILLFLRGDNNKLVWNASETGAPGPYFNVTSTVAFSANTWYHAVVTFNNSTDTDGAKLYINGSLDNSGQARSANIESSNDVHIGNSGLALDWPFHGKIDQTRFFTKVLSSSEVSTLYAETLATSTSLDPLSEDTTDTLQVLGDSSCIATYRFENDEVDLSGNYNGTGTEIQYAAGRYGQAASFNGSSSSVSVTTTSTTPLDFSARNYSLSVWVNTTSTTTSSVLSKYGDSDAARSFTLLLQANGTIRHYERATGTSTQTDSTATVNDGSWHHIAVTKSSTQTTLYIDNVATTNNNTFTSNNGGTEPFRIGRDNPGSPDWFNGKIDQVRLFNKTLSASEVTTLYNENSLVASYRFEGNANDDTRNYDGTPTNVTYEYGLGFTPDFVFIKSRNITYSGNITDSTRGTTKQLYTTGTSADQTNSTFVTSFDTGGFTVGNNAYVNINGYDFVAWCLKANGGTTSSNTDGTITSTVQANTDAGFSIVEYTGDGANGTVGHGLGVAPDIVLVKRLNSTGNWSFNGSVGGLTYGTNKLVLQTTAAISADTNEVLAATSTTFTAGTSGSVGASGGDYIAYCFHSVDSFSKIGAYTGNNSTDGPIVETGFEPAFVMVKRTDAAGSGWAILDNKRNPSNRRNLVLWPNSAEVEYTAQGGGGIDFLSNGFQVNSTETYLNASGGTYIFMAFAADPDTEAPTVAKSFSTVAYTGDGTTGRQISTGFQPSLVWTKGRNNSSWAHFLQDSVRGAENFIKSNTTDAEATTLPNIVSSFNDDGFVIENNGNSNANGDTYVAWAWKADDNEPTILPNTELSSLISKYKFNDNVDDDYGDNNASPSNLSFVTGKFKKAADFNGSSSKITYPQVSPFNDSNTILAISAWVKLDSASDEFVIMSASSTSDQNVSVQLIVGGNKAGRVFISNAANNQQEIQANFGSTNNTNWNHYVWQLSSSNGIELWFNGVSQTRTQTYQAGSINTGSWFGDLTYPTDVNYATGINRVVTTAYYNGAIDQMRLFNAELTSSEISSLYNEANEALVSANANAGFSIVKYEGNSTAGRKVPHGLSAVPQMIIVKRLESPNDNWAVYNETIGNTKRLALDETGAAASNRLEWNSTTPSATTFTLGNHSAVNTNSSYIAYCFHSVSSYSKIGSYTGTGSTGNVINVGFQPDFIILKNTSSGTNGDGWFIFDTVRSGNPINVNLQAQQADAESGPYAYTITISSSGFEPTGSFANFTGTNASGNTYIYMAFKIN